VHPYLPLDAVSGCRPPVPAPQPFPDVLLDRDLAGGRVDVGAVLKLVMDLGVEPLGVDLAG
jgi:hypothetical protein